jgi:cytochrome c biogenesis protein CcdA
MTVLTLGALVAGVLTTLAPCVLPLLPVIVGGSLGPATSTNRRRALILTTSLGSSIFIFTLLLKATTVLIDIPTSTWQWISGIILITLGMFSVFPKAWDVVSMKLSLQARTNQRLSTARSRDGLIGTIFTGSALGPVFSSCSPFYGYVIVTVLPASISQGLVLLLAYVIGLCGTLLVIALLGQKVMGKARWLANPEGGFKKVIGLLFILVGLAVILGLDKDFQTWFIENSPIRIWELDSDFIPER